MRSMASDQATATPGKVPTRWSVLLLAGLATLLLNGCGFHLQGAVNLPGGIHTVYIAASDELTPFAVAVKRTLARSGASLSATSAGADAVLRITKDRTGRRVLSVSASNTPQEYEVYYQIEYSIDHAGKEAVPSQPMELTRNFAFEESQLLAKDREEDVLREAMAQDLATLVVRRLESL